MISEPKFVVGDCWDGSHPDMTTSQHLPSGRVASDKTVQIVVGSQCRVGLKNHCGSSWAMPKGNLIFSQENPLRWKDGMMCSPASCITNAPKRKLLNYQKNKLSELHLTQPTLTALEIVGIW